MSMTTDNDAPAAGLVEALNWKNGEARSRRGDLYEVINLSDIVWQTRKNGTAFPEWSTSESRAKDAAQAECARSAALQAPQEAGVVVKALEWRDHRGQTFPDTWTAQTPCGVYEIEERSASDSPAYVATGPLHVFLADKDSLEDAKAAAQADFEARIRSALSQPVATPAPSQDAVVVRLEGEIARLEDEFSEARQTWPEWARRVYAFMRKYGFYESSEDDIHLPDDLEAWFDETIETEVNSRLAATRPAEAQAVAEGWKLVPVDPTQAMLDAGYYPSVQGRGAKSTWQEMLAASPATGGA